MAQILDPLPSNSACRILCCYVNATNQIQIARISNIQNWYFERVVFPGQRLVFEAVSQAVVEIHTGSMASAIISDHIPCERLQIEQQDLPSPDKATVRLEHQLYVPPLKTARNRQVIVEPLTTPALTAVD